MALFRRHNQGENKPKTEEEKRRELEVEYHRIIDEYHRIIDEAARDEKKFWDLLLNDSCFCLNDNYSFADGSQNPSGSKKAVSNVYY